MTILEAFRMIAPEFKEIADDVAEGYIDFYCSVLNKELYGNKYEMIAAYYLAHCLALNQLVAEGGSSSATLVSGSIISEKEGDLTRSYSQNSAEDSFDKTIYGKESKRLSKLFVIPVMTRMG